MVWGPGRLEGVLSGIPLGQLNPDSVETGCREHNCGLSALEAQLAALAIYCVRRIGLCDCRVLC